MEFHDVKYIRIPDDKWFEFLKIAFNYSDYFSLKYITNKKYDYSLCDYIDNELSNWHIYDKDYTVWPDFKTKYYMCNFFTMKILASIGGISKFGGGIYPEDLSFFKDDKVWFENVSHEKISFFKSTNLKLKTDLICNNIILI